MGDIILSDKREPGGLIIFDTKGCKNCFWTPNEGYQNFFILLLFCYLLLFVVICCYFVVICCFYCHSLIPFRLVKYHRPQLYSKDASKYVPLRTECDFVRFMSRGVECVEIYLMDPTSTTQLVQ